MSSAPTPEVAGTVFEDSTPELTRNYAAALINVASASGQADAVLDELDELVDDLLVHDRRFAGFFDSPAVASADKDRVLGQMFEGKASPVLLNFLRVLNQNGRMALLGPVARRAREAWDLKQNRRRVTVRSAAPLDDDQRGRLHDRLAALLAATPVVRYEVDPELIGGLVVQVGDVVYDVSVRHQLQRLRHQLVERAHEVTRSAAAVVAP